MSKSKSINKPFNAKALGVAMVAKRTKDSLTIHQSCETSGVAPATYFRAEAASGKIDVGTLVSICNWLGVPVQTFFK